MGLIVQSWVFKKKKKCGVDLRRALQCLFTGHRLAAGMPACSSCLCSSYHAVTLTLSNLRPPTSAKDNINTGSSL